MLKKMTFGDLFVAVKQSQKGLPPKRLSITERCGNIVVEFVDARTGKERFAEFSWNVMTGRWDYEGDEIT